MHPPPSPASATCAHQDPTQSSTQGSLPVMFLGPEVNCGKKRAQLYPCGPDGRQSLRPMSARSWMAARPWPSSHSRGAGAKARAGTKARAGARAKAQILPELR